MSEMKTAMDAEPGTALEEGITVREPCPSRIERLTEAWRGAGRPRTPLYRLLCPSSDLKAGLCSELCQVTGSRGNISAKLCSVSTAFVFLVPPVHSSRFSDVMRLFRSKHADLGYSGRQ